MIFKNTIKKINKSLGRFLSLVAIIMLGVGFYAGIRQTTPAIRDVQNSYTAKTNMMDLRIVSTLGITDKDLEELKKLENVQYVSGGFSMFGYSGEDVVRVMSIDRLIDRSQICEGRAPANERECLADKNFYKVGNIIKITEPSGDDTSDKLKVHSYIVSGTVTNPIYMGKDLGSADIGNGELHSYILVKPDVFKFETYTECYITMEKSEEDVPYSDSYNEKLEALKDQVKKIKTDREKSRERELYEEAKEKALEEVEKKHDEIEKEVRSEIEKEVRKAIEKEQEESRKKLREKAGRLGKTIAELAVMLGDKINEAFEPISEERVKSLVNEQLPEAMKKAMFNARTEALAEIEIPECKWYMQTRNEVVTSYKILIDQYKEVESIADIIPIFFIVIVFLMTSNTMSRMIADERGEMGTLSSLGFSNGRIIGGYMIYVLIATLMGVVGGYFLGVLTLPKFVFACFPLSVPDISFSFDWKMFVGSLAVSFIVMTLVTIFSCMKELVSKPAYLLRPVPPRSGKTLLLERITFLWNHISFSWKTTLRNISRYKRRGIMTIIGVGGCTFLMFIGFALRDCISSVGDKQFSEILHYDVMAILGEPVDSFDDIDSENENLSDLLKEPLMIRQETMKVENEKNYTLDFYLQVVNENDPNFTKYVTMRGADPRDCKLSDDIGCPVKGEDISLSDDGVVITPRIADIMDAGVGSSIVIRDNDGEEYEVKISAITENYVSNYMYMSETMYEKLFDKDVEYNTILAINGLREDSRIQDENDSDIVNSDASENLSRRLYKLDSFVSVNTTDVVLRRANDTIKGLDSIVIMLVVIASMLAFTVLYNLTAISISERTREIATLKVLGFTPEETNDYIYRETIIGAVFGIAAGLLVAPYLLGKVLDLISVDMIIFLREIKKPSFYIAAGLALCFSLAMMLVTYIKLNRINMIESLKSVD